MDRPRPHSILQKSGAYHPYSGATWRGPQTSVLTERAESDTCLTSVQQGELAKAAGKSGDQSLQQSRQALRWKTQTWGVRAGWGGTSRNLGIRSMKLE